MTGCAGDVVTGWAAAPSPLQATAKPDGRWWRHLKHREGGNPTMASIDLIVLLLPGEGIHRKYGQFTGIDHCVAVTGGVR